MINPVSSFKSVPAYQVKRVKQHTQNVTPPLANSISINSNPQQNIIQEISPIKLTQANNVYRVSFNGRLKDPQIPSLQMKVRGVSQHQRDFENEQDVSKDRNIEDLAKSDWYDGKELNFAIVQERRKSTIELSDPDFGEIGRVPDEIAPMLKPLLQKYPNDFQFKLSNVIAGNSKSAPTIGLRVNLIYTGKDKEIKEKTQQAFDSLLNSNDKKVKDCVMLYQKATSPKEVLKRIFDIESKNNGPHAAKEIEKVINTISREINDPNNKNILLLGHCVPDGDTIGCVLGMHAAIKSTYPDKNVQCSIDDKLPGLYRENLPGIENIKRPYNADSIKRLEANIKELEAQEQTPVTKSQIAIYKRELSFLNRNEAYFDADVKDGAEPEKYDLVILMDIPSPKRFSGAFKNYIENAGKVIYIDHHPERPEEWNKAKDVTGLDMTEVKKNHNALIVPAVPAAAQLVTIVAHKAGLLEKTLADAQYAKQYAAGVISGTSSDTGCFSRSANLTPKDIKAPVRQRPNFLPEGLSKWLVSKMDGQVDKKWIRENIVYDISDKKSAIENLSSREKMLKHSMDSHKVYPDTGLGFVSISYDQLYDIWESALEYDEQVTLLDIQNSLKYSEVMNTLRESIELNKKSSGIKIEETKYEDDKIAILMIQDKEKGKIDENSQLAPRNGIRMSFRSQEGTNYAEMLATLFNGGGHGGAAGGRIDLDGVTVNSKIAISIDGKPENNPTKIYNALKQNFDIKEDNSLSSAEKSKLTHKFAPVLDENGIKIQDLINGVVTQIRRNNIEEETTKIKKNRR